MNNGVQKNIDTHKINTLTTSMSEATACIKNKMSLIPVWDSNNKEKIPKSPCLASWKKHQDVAMTEGDLYSAFEYYNTTAFGAVCGKASGNLECIDIDSKFEPGIDSLILKDIESMMPELANKLRYHRTPSGGVHIIYRIADHPAEGNQKLAGREKSEEELKADKARGVSKPTRTTNFLETRGEGGYFVYPPSEGYSKINNVDIPEITWAERCSLINLCRSYDRIIKVEPTPRPTKSQDSQYTTNPFEDFNNNCDPISLMSGFGWKCLPYSNNRFIWFTRPGKDKGVSASFNQSKRVFYIFTSSTELESEKGYNPASILSTYLHGGDKKQTFKYLIDNGYGKLKSNVEKAIVKQAIHKKLSGPANLSQEAKEAISIGIEKEDSNYPYGIFWEFDEKGRVAIPINAVLQVLAGLGFRNYHGKVVKISHEPNIVDTSITDPLNEIVSSLIDYVKEENADTYSNIINALDEKFSTKAKYIRERLANLDPEILLKDGRNSAYKCYKNGIVEVDSTGVKLHNYSFLSDNDLFVLDKNVEERNYFFDVEGSPLFKEFITNSLGWTSYIKKVLGYLAHKGKRENSTFLIVQTERVASVKEGGGSGKNVTTSMLNYFNKIHEVDGASAKVDATLTQGWSDEGIVVISDVKRNFPYVGLKNAITNNMLCKRLYQNIAVIPFKESPKFIVSTNYSYDTGDGGLDRRIRVLEYTNFYSRQGGVDKYHGKMFPDDFTAEDWKGFDDVMIECLQAYFEANGEIEKIELSDTGKIKQLTSKYGDAVLEQFEELVDNLSQNIPVGFVKNLQSSIREMARNGTFWGQKIEQMSSQEKYELIKFFAREKGLSFKKNENKGYNNATGLKEWLYEFIKE